MTTSEQPSGPGATGGLPGDNAGARTDIVSEDEKADTVSGVGPATGVPAGEEDGDTAANG